MDIKKAANDEISGARIILIARRTRGYSQLELAEVYGVSEKTIRRWERGQTSISFDDVIGILNLLGLSFEEVKHVAA